jgi:phosphatidylglycerophosphatase A
MTRPPSVRFAFGHPAHVIALGFGTGLAPLGPGTAGTMLAFPIYILLDRWLGVMFDDVVAAFYTLLLVAIVKRAFF